MNNWLNPSLTLFTAVFIEPFFHENSRVSMLNVICQYLNNLHQCSCSPAKDRLKMVRSVAWLYFEKNVRPGKKTVTCTICKRTQTFPGNTSNMFVHLQNHHPDIYKEISTKIGKKPKNKRRESNRPNGLLNCDELRLRVDCTACISVYWIHQRTVLEDEQTETDR